MDKRASPSASESNLSFLTISDLPPYSFIGSQESLGSPESVGSLETLETLESHEFEDGSNTPRVFESSEKKSSLPCDIHTKSDTPHLDALLQQPGTKARIRALSSALADVADDECCSKCATESAVHLISAYLDDFKQARKNKHGSTDEHKALKAEMKGYIKGIRRDLKKTRKARRQK